jgi:hypothetical protein
LKKEITVHFNYQIVKRALSLEKASKWLVKDSTDDFFPDALDFADVTQHIDGFLEQRRHRILQIDSFPYVSDYVPKASGMIREAVWLHPMHRILYLAILHYLLPKLDHHLPPEVYSYRRDVEEIDEYPFPRKMDRWRDFHNDFRIGAIDEQTNAVLITDIASFYDHIKIEDLSSRIRALLGAGATEEDLEVVNFLEALLKQWSLDGYGIPQNLDASSFLGSLFLSGVDREIIGKRYRYFRWVDDIRICARNKKQALRALHDLQSALARHRMFLASDKTKIIERGTDEFEELLDVGDDEHLSKIEDVIARASRDEIQDEIPRAVDRMTHHAGTHGDDRKFRAFANRLLQISEYGEFHDEVLDYVIPLVKDRLESHPHKSDYWAKMLQEGATNMWQETIDQVLRTDPSVYNWQRFYLWRLLTASSELSEPLKMLARSTINNPISELEAYQAIVCLGKHGDAQDRENLFVEFFSPQRSYPIQRAILIAIQDLHQDLRDKFYERALMINPEHKQLVEYLKGRENPKYGVRLRPIRSLPQQPRVLNVGFLRGLGKVGGKVVRYRLARADYDYD